MVFWLYGLSGAGKTTLGRKLERYLLETHSQVYVIDGDLVRSVLNNDLSYSVEDRRTNVKRIILAAYVLSENKVPTIVCNIHPFEDLRWLAKSKLHGYHQIFVQRSLEDLRQKDEKKVYENSDPKNIVGMGIPFEESALNDLIIETDGQSEEASFEKLKVYVKKVWNPTLATQKEKDPTPRLQT